MRTSRVATVAGLAGLLALTVTGCSADEVLRFGWPEGITPEAHSMRQLWTWSVIAALAVGVLVWGLLIWSVTFHRKKKGDKEFPRQFQYNVPLELFAVGLPTVMVCALFYFTVSTETDVVRSEKPNPDVTVDVVAFQWNWEFRYQGEETPDGEVVRTTGSSSEIPLLVVPTDRRIQFNLRSTDVIHAFWVPELLFKRDVMPQPERNNQDHTFQITKIDREGAFVGRCAELCGTYHAVMNFELRALSPDKYDQYMQLRRSVNQETGQPYTAAEALEEMDCGELCSPTATSTKPFNTDRLARTASG
ncbi:cytochrome c oxidase subunit II [Thermocrispum municipale]|uniref:aa3-type cytochrome oxidase subunit II n=1 Tax=Thermocrispum municipale TaxID=37926 RepID=UPI0004012725|nr:cytochrome c oxidase subunit II [Thermocrispum municipale]